MPSYASHAREDGHYEWGNFCIPQSIGCSGKSVDSILLDENGLTADAIDMETFWVYKHGENPLSIMTVTDTKNEPFYSLRPSDERIHKGIEVSIGMLGDIARRCSNGI